MVDIFSNYSFINDTEENYTSVNPTSTIRFWILLIFEIPSLFCCLILLYYLCVDRTLRQSINNHVLIALLFITLTSQTVDVCNYLTFLRLGYVWPQTSTNCYIWWIVSTASYNAIGILMAWASIERHILIFHHQLFSTQKNRILFHYIPLITIVVYPWIFYTVCVFFPPCENIIDYTELWCYGPCFSDIKPLMLFDIFFNAVLPSFLIIISSILLFVRVIRRKQRLRQQVQWHKYRRMIIQLVSCSSLFLLFNLPLFGFYIAHIFGLPYGSTGEFELSLYFMGYFTIVWMPFVCFGSSPEIWIKVKRLKCFTNIITPQILQPVR